MKRRIAILGEFQTGKSTLVNCLLGRVLAAVGRGFHTTQVPTVYRHGLALRASRMTRAGASEPIDAEQLADTQAAVNWSDVRAVEVEYPHPLLERFDLIDTPGLDACALTDEVVAAVAGDADSILLLVAKPLGRNTFTEFIRGALADQTFGVVLNCGINTPERPGCAACEGFEGEVLAWLNDVGLPQPLFTSRVNLRWVHDHVAGVRRRPVCDGDADFGSLEANGFSAPPTCDRRKTRLRALRQRRDLPRKRTGTLVIRRKNRKDGVPSQKIKVRTRREGGGRCWEKRGSLEPGDAISIPLEAGDYEVKVRIKDKIFGKDKDTVEVVVEGDAEVRLVTHGEDDPDVGLLVYIGHDQ